MKVVVQRVSEAGITINGKDHRTIKKGLVVLLGIEGSDGMEDGSWLIKKLCALRIFGDDEGKMNLSISDVQGDILVVSQFTLHASTKKGNRPSYVRAARPEIAIPLYDGFISGLKDHFQGTVETGEFGANMKISMVNDGPVTIIMDSKNKE